MKKSEILKMFGNRVVISQEFKDSNILVIYVTHITWKDLNLKTIENIIDIQPWDGLSMRLAIDIDDWN